MLLAAPPDFVEQCQNDCVVAASKILNLCEVVHAHCSSLVPPDPTIAMALYQAIRITLWDAFRHPTPGVLVKSGITEVCEPALRYLQVMAELFPFAARVVGRQTQRHGADK